MKNTIFIGGAVALMFGFSPVVLAQSPSWNYLSASWVVNGEVESGATSIDIEGFQFSATKNLGDMFFVRVAANNFGVDSAGTVTDLSDQQMGGGIRFGVAPGLDLWASVSYDRYDYTGAVGTGFGAEVGVRWQLMKEMELGLAYKNSPNLDFGTADAKFSGYELTAVYNMAPTVGIMLTASNRTFDAGASSLDYKNVVGLGVRLAY